MVSAKECTYEKIYFSLWETGQRYGEFTQFRIIGKSHDDRLIPMLEVGKGDICIFCLSGLEEVKDGDMPLYLTKMMREYCRAYESGWIMGENYHVTQLLDQIRICFIPLLNPDGYEISTCGYGAIRNPIYRQMLKMQNRPLKEIDCNARGIKLRKNFPTNYYQKNRIGQEPASENETRAFIHILQEYRSAGLLLFGHAHGKIIYYKQEKSVPYNQKNYRMARHLQRCSGYHLEKGSAQNREMGSPEQFYAEVFRQPSLSIEIPQTDDEDFYREEVFMLPLEYIYSGHSIFSLT